MSIHFSRYHAISSTPALPLTPITSTSVPLHQLLVQIPLQHVQQPLQRQVIIPAGRYLISYDSEAKSLRPCISRRDVFDERGVRLLILVVAVRGGDDVVVAVSSVQCFCVRWRQG